MTYDYHVEDHGTIFLIRPQNAAAHEHLEENVADDAIWLGNALAVEHRYIENLVLGLRDNGWTVTNHV